VLLLQFVLFFTLSCLSLLAYVVLTVQVLLKYECFVQVLHVLDICKILPEYTVQRPKRDNLHAGY
jgi:hypothetical protein